MNRVMFVLAGVTLLALLSSTQLVTIGYAGARSIIELAAIDIEASSHAAAVARTSVQVVVPPAGDVAVVSPPEVTLVQQFVRQFLSLFGFSGT